MTTLNSLEASIILDTDSYKYAHYMQIPRDTLAIESYMGPRGGMYDEVFAFGYQAWVIDRLINNPLTRKQIDFAEEIVTAHGEPFNRAGFEQIVDVHGGYFPVEIRAVPEGTLLPNPCAHATITSTDPRLPWVGGFLETSFLRNWYTSDVMTTSFRLRRIIAKYLAETGDLAGLNFKLHDFGSRGVSSRETALLGGLAHLAAGSMGTDTVAALIGARMFYDEKSAGFSIPASEHSTMTARGREGEAAQFEMMIDKFAGKGNIYACVSDGYDIFNAVRNIWGGVLRDKVKNSGGTLVVRPDSGDPVEVTLKVVEILGEKFGYTVNEKGYKVLADCVRIIQGDGVDETSVDAILSNFKQNGWSADNIAFGIGGKLLQAHTRDDNRWALKACARSTPTGWVDVFKDPITDQGKKSLRGRVAVVSGADGVVKTVRADSVAPGEQNLLRTIYKNGVLFNQEDLATIRARAQQYL